MTMRVSQIVSLLLIAFSLSSSNAQQYGVRMRWTSNAQSCTDEPAEIEYWPIGSPFAEYGSGTCVDVPLASGGHAYYTYTTTNTIPTAPSAWSPFYALETYYENETQCAGANPSDVYSVTMTNSDSCIFAGASSMGYYYMKLACSSETSGQVFSCRDSACTDCRTPFNFPGGCDDFVNSVHSCVANTPASEPTTSPTEAATETPTEVPTEAPTAAPTAAYGLRKRWISSANGCQDEPASIDYWPTGSIFARVGSGECVETLLGGGGVAYYTYTTSDSIPSVPSTWSPVIAVETFFTNNSMCQVADPSTVELVTIQNADACIYMGGSTTGYHWMKKDCQSEDSGKVLSCNDSACTDCRTPWDYQGGCDDYVNSVHFCSAH